MANGLTALTTCGSLAALANDWSTAACCWATVVPAGDWKTSCPTKVLCPGKSSSMTWVPWSDWLPGTV